MLLFTQMTSLMDILGRFFELRGYSYLRLDGSVRPKLFPPPRLRIAIIMTLFSCRACRQQLMTARPE